MLRHSYVRNYHNLLAVPFLLGGLLALVTAPGTVHAETLYGFGGNVSPILYSFDSASPGSFLTTTNMSGLVTGHSLRAIDFRPSNGTLYAVSSQGSAVGQLYTVNLTSGALTTVGSTFALTGNTTVTISMDFDPVRDQIRVLTASGANLRVDPDTGGLINADTTVPGSIVGDIAYFTTPSSPGSTTLYAYSTALNAIGIIGSAGNAGSSDSGGFTPLGPSGFTLPLSIAVGFDISSASGVAYLSGAATGVGNPNPELFTANLANGTLTLVGSFSSSVVDIAVPVGVAAVNGPEPGTFALLALGTLTAGIVIRRRQA